MDSNIFIHSNDPKFKNTGFSVFHFFTFEHIHNIGMLLKTVGCGFNLIFVFRDPKVI